MALVGLRVGVGVDRDSAFEVLLGFAEDALKVFQKELLLVGQVLIICALQLVVNRIQSFIINGFLLCLPFLCRVHLLLHLHYLLLQQCDLDVISAFLFA